MLLMRSNDMQFPAPPANSQPNASLSVEGILSPPPKEWKSDMRTGPRSAWFSWKAIDPENARGVSLAVRFREWQCPSNPPDNWTYSLLRGRAQKIGGNVPETGGCLCGAVRLSYHGQVGPAGYCHCEDCRRCTGSAFNISVKVELSDLEFEGEEMAAFTKIGESGHPLTRHFCRRCGSPIMTTSPRHAGTAYVKGGVWDDPQTVNPAHQAWMSSAVGWRVVSDSLPSYPRGKA